MGHDRFLHESINSVLRRYQISSQISTKISNRLYRKPPRTCEIQQFCHSLSSNIFSCDRVPAKPIVLRHDYSDPTRPHFIRPIISRVTSGRWKLVSRPVTLRLNIWLLSHPQVEVDKRRFHGTRNAKDWKERCVRWHVNPSANSNYRHRVLLGSATAFQTTEYRLTKIDLRVHTTRTSSKNVCFIKF